MARTVVSDDQKQAIFEKREAGWSCPRIGRHLGIHPETVAWHCMAMGVLKAGQPRKVSPPGRQTMRNGRPVRPFLPDEDVKLTALRQAGHSIPDICIRLGRRTSSVRNRLLTLAAREESAHG